MLWFLVSCSIGACTVFIAEQLRKQKRISSEASRKLTHMAHGIIVAFWPFWVSYPIIIVAEIVFVTAVLLARRFKFLHAMRNVKRTSWGDVFFPIAVVLIALTRPQHWIFMTALLELGIADGLAALVGKKLRSKRYLVIKRYKQYKSIAGTAAFWLASIIVIYIGMHVGHLPIHDPVILYSLFVIPVINALVENLSPYGSDNITIPIITVLLLSMTPR